VRAAVLATERRCYRCGCALVPPPSPRPRFWRPAPNTATVDHIVPISRGGSRLDRANLRAACWSCNSSKGARLLVVEAPVVEGPRPAALSFFDDDGEVS